VPSRRPSTHRFGRVVPLAALAIVITACSAAPGGTAAPAGSGASGGSAAPSGTPLTVGLGFIPSIQFAPFYLAEREGYYREAGLQVTLQHKSDPDLVTLIGQGAVDVGLADGTSVIPAVSNGIPIRYIATIYGKFPSVVFSKESAGIDDPADLRGKSLAIPGRYGSSWVMLQALLRSVDLTANDLEIREYPDYGQGAAVQQGAVDAATGFVNNEPVQLKLSGETPVVLTVDEVVPLPGPGLIAGASTLESKRDALKAFTAATLRAMDEIAADPQKGYDASVPAVPELATKPDVQKAILAATIDAWEPVGGGRLGAVDEDAWKASIDFLRELKLVPKPVSVRDVVDLTFLPS
jgi:NitT/TauT family transport system substrate-binding protein